MRWLRPILAAVALLFCTVASAHKPSDSYLTLVGDGQHLDGHWDIALRDLDAVLGLDRDGDAAITWGEVRARWSEIDRYALDHLALATQAGTCRVGVHGHRIDRHTDGSYAVLDIDGTCPDAIDALTVDYSLLFDIDAQHRGLVNFSTKDNGARTVAAVFPSDRRTQTIGAGATRPWSQFASFVGDGVKHIATGYDHILFLVALLLPSVLRRESGRWVPVADVRSTLWTVGKTVTAFTLAHSLTLTLATLHVVALPSRLTESAIALSVLVTAIDNVVPFLPRRRWLVAFVFGLMHGFGFASVLLDLDLPTSALALSLFGFNIGVELGQLILVAILIPPAFLARTTLGYRRIAFNGGSAAIAAIACAWFIERSFNVSLFPF
jgi:hypothetical protein